MAAISSEARCAQSSAKPALRSRNLSACCSRGRCATLTFRWGHWGAAKVHWIAALPFPDPRDLNTLACAGSPGPAIIRIAIMLIGVPKEIKDSEYRVGLVPSTVRELTLNGHRVLVEQNAGLGAGLADADYQAAGAEIVAGPDQVFGSAELIVKVKEPLAVERKKLKPGQAL